MGCIYLIRNTTNGKCYIGQSARDAKRARIEHHLCGRGNRYLANAVKKHGKESFEWEILHDGVINEFLSLYETEAIAKYNTVRPHGYNLTTGGEGGIPCEETRRKIGDAHRGKVVSEESRQKMSKARKGTSPSAETRQKFSERSKGCKNPMYGTTRTFTPDILEKISTNVKASWTPEKREQYSERMKGKNNPIYGKPRSAEVRRKISETKKRRAKNND